MHYATGRSAWRSCAFIFGPPRFESLALRRASYLDDERLALDGGRTRSALERRDRLLVPEIRWRVEAIDTRLLGTPWAPTSYSSPRWRLRCLDHAGRGPDAAVVDLDQADVERVRRRPACRLCCARCSPNHSVHISDGQLIEATGGIGRSEPSTDVALTRDRACRTSDALDEPRDSERRHVCEARCLLLTTVSGKSSGDYEVSGRPNRSPQGRGAAQSVRVQRRRRVV
jgi:hypothetical protein